MTEAPDPTRFVQPRLTIEREVKWVDIAPLLDELQQDPDFHSLVVERQAFRIAAGGPGFDIVPILVMVGLTQLVIEAVKDAYPRLKDALVSLYQKLPGHTETGNVYPIGFAVVEGELEAQYRVPEGLSVEAFGEAVNTVSTHFTSLKGEEPASLVFTYDPEAKGWVENVDASQFLTANAKRVLEEGSRTPLAD